MGQEIFNDLKLNFTDRSPTVQQICQTLEYNFEQVATAGADYSSLVLAGGAGFGDFNPQSSDVDAWLIIPDLEPASRLQRSKELNLRYEIAKVNVINEGILGEHNFRHPPTFLTEKESAGYRKAFAAKIGLPIALGVFPTLIGNERKGEICFTEEQLVQDLAYSCGVFQENLLNPPANNIENPLRYCYKRATYFLRFKLLYERGIYVPRQERLLAISEQELPEWQPIIPMLRQARTPELSGQPDIKGFQYSVNQAMQKGMDRFYGKEVLDDLKNAKGEVRTELFWTLEKLRWDFLLLQRNPVSLRVTMSDGGQKTWGFSFSQIDALFGKFFKFVPETKLVGDWERFRREHGHAVTTRESESLGVYYDQVYHPNLVTFFDKAATYVDELF